MIDFPSKNGGKIVRLIEKMIFKGSSKSVSILSRFFDAFGRLLGSTLAARRRPRRVQDPPGTRQEVARTRPGEAKKRRKLGFGCQDGLESDLGPILGGFLVDFRSDFGWIFDGFGVEF